MTKPNERYFEGDHVFPRMKYDEPITIHLLGDLHFGTKMHCDESFKAWCDKWEPEFKRGGHYAVLLGDMINDYRYTDQVRLAALYAQGTEICKLSDLVRDEMDEIAGKLAFLKGSTIVGVEGNHGWVFPGTGETADEYLCGKLGAKYGGAVAYISMRMKIGKKNLDINMFCFHGRGATMYLGGNLNEPERIIPKFEARLIFAGHAHQSVGGKRARMRKKFGKPGMADEIVLLRAGSFRRTYTHGSGDYATRMQLNPSVLTMPHVTLTPRKADGGFIELTYHG